MSVPRTHSTARGRLPRPSGTAPATPGTAESAQPLRADIKKAPKGSQWNSMFNAVCSRIAYSDQKRPWCSYLLPAGEGAPQRRMRAELRALARKSPHPAVPARPRKRGFPRSPREKERRPRRACNSTVLGLSLVAWAESSNGLGEHLHNGLCEMFRNFFIFDYLQSWQQGLDLRPHGPELGVHQSVRGRASQISNSSSTTRGSSRVPPLRSRSAFRSTAGSRSTRDGPR